MEQKRTLAGDDTNGHESSASGIYNTFSTRMRKKQKSRQLKTTRKDLMSWPPCLGHSLTYGNSSKDSRISLIRPLTVPDIFVKKPTPPLKSYRTGKVWSLKRPCEPIKRIRTAIAKSRSDSHLLSQEPRLLNRRHSLIDQDLLLIHNRASPATFTPCFLHSLSQLNQKSSPSACRGFICMNCLIDVGYISYVTRSKLTVDSSLINLLNNFIHTSSFQHILFC